MRGIKSLLGFLHYAEVYSHLSMEEAIERWQRVCDSQEELRQFFLRKYTRRVIQVKCFGIHNKLDALVLKHQ